MLVVKQKYDYLAEFLTETHPNIPFVEIQEEFEMWFKIKFGTIKGKIGRPEELRYETTGIGECFVVEDRTAAQVSAALVSYHKTHESRFKTRKVAKDGQTMIIVWRVK